jgi:hypothetical protein
MNNWIVPIVFLILPFAFLAPGLIWKSQLLFFLICPVIIIAMNLKNVWIKAFLLYATTWQIFIFLMAFNLRGFSPGPGLSVLISLMAGAFIFKFVSEGTLPNEKWYTVIRIAVIVQILISLSQPWGFNPVIYVLGFLTKVKDLIPGHLVGTLGNRNFLAAFIAFSVPFFIGWRTFRVGRFSVNPALIGIFGFLALCLSPGTLAAIIGMGFFLSFRLPFWKRMVAWSLAVKIAVAFAAAYVLITGNHLNEFQALPGQLRELIATGRITVNPFESDVGRFAMWMMAFSELIKSWVYMVFGFGPGALWGREYPIHAEYMSVWFQFGLVGLGLMLGYIFTTGRYLWKNNKLILLTSFIIICLDMVGNFPAEIASTAFMMIIVCGLIERERNTATPIQL